MILVFLRACLTFYSRRKIWYELYIRIMRNSWKLFFFRARYLISICNNLTEFLFSAGFWNRLFNYFYFLLQREMYHWNSQPIWCVNSGLWKGQLVVSWCVLQYICWYNNNLLYIIFEIPELIIVRYNYKSWHDFSAWFIRKNIIIEGLFRHSHFWLIIIPIKIILL